MGNDRDLAFQRKSSLNIAKAQKYIELCFDLAGNGIRGENCSGSQREDPE